MLQTKRLQRPERRAARRSLPIIGALLLGAAAAMFVSGARALTATSDDPEAIVAAVAQRNLGKRVLTRLRMVIHDDTGSRERVIAMRSNTFDHDVRTLIRVEGPAEVKDTALVSVDYDDPNKVDEQWLYLPNLHRTTRVPSDNHSGAFMSSDFSYADLSRPDYRGYALRLLDSDAKVDDDACWLIEAVPKSSALRERTGYAKTQLWVSKSKQMPVQFKSWVIEGRRVKYVKLGKLEQIDGIWTPLRLQARTMAGSKFVSETVLDVLSVEYGAKAVTDDDFTVQRLAPGG
jgi:hypothetical protein